MQGVVEAVCKGEGHNFSKRPQDSITIVEGVGVEGDAHAGATVQHLSRLERTAQAPNLRQVHVVHAELLEQLQAQGFDVGPGSIGENILCRGLEVLSMPKDTVLAIGDAAVQISGLRNPCKQLNDHKAGLMGACLERDAEGNLVRKAGVMCVAIKGGRVRPGDTVRVILPPEPHQPLSVV
jgi:MOSC domain-containing protein YiiM